MPWIEEKLFESRNRLIHRLAYMGDTHVMSACHATMRVIRWHASDVEITCAQCYEMETVELADGLIHYVVEMRGHNGYVQTVCGYWRPSVRWHVSDVATCLRCTTSPH